MRILVSAIMLVACLASLVPDRAAAYETWCADDPVVSVGSRLADIQVQQPADKVAVMRATTLTVIIPQNVPGAVVVDDVSAFPMRTTVVARGPKWDGAGPIPVTIVVEVTASSSYPVRVVASPLPSAATPLASPVTATGTSNARIEL